MPFAARRPARAIVAVLAAVTLVPALGAAQAAAQEADPVPTGDVTTAALPDELEVSGRGWGHGRGMGQYGALGYATGITGEAWDYSRILDHYYGGTVVGHTEDRLMAVWLRSRPANSAMVVYRASGLEIAGQDDTPPAVRVTPRGDNLYDIQTGTSCTGPWSTNERIVEGPVRVAKMTGSDEGALRLCYSDGTQIAYDDSTELAAIDDKTVNVVRQEEMLRGIVPRESPASWGNLDGGINALRAQAVAARSYAAAGDTRWGDLHTRLGADATTCDNQYCQVYGGVAYVSASGAITTRTHPNTDRAITDTSLEVRRMPNGNLARTEFSSSTGGWTVGGAYPAVEDLGDAVASNPNHTWTTSLTRQRIEQKYPSIGTLTDVQILERNGLGDMGGRVLRMRLVGTAGDVDRTGDQFRLDFGLKSNWFTVTVPPPPTREPRAITTACPTSEVPRDAFADVDPAGTHAMAIDCVAWRDIAEGTSATTFEPARPVTRAQMASFVARLVVTAGGSLPSDPTDAFDDDDGSTHEDAINRLAAVGIVQGTGPRTYEPQTSIDRGQLASIVARALTHLGVTLDPEPASPFSDDNGSTHELAIDQLAAEGVVAGTGPGTYSPKATTRRDQMASTLARALDLQLS